MSPNIANSFISEPQQNGRLKEEVVCIFCTDTSCNRCINRKPVNQVGNQSVVDTMTIIGNMKVSDTNKTNNSIYGKEHEFGDIVKKDTLFVYNGRNNILGKVPHPEALSDKTNYPNANNSTRRVFFNNGRVNFELLMCPSKRLEVDEEYKDLYDDLQDALRL